MRGMVRNKKHLWPPDPVSALLLFALALAMLVFISAPFILSAQPATHVAHPVTVAGSAPAPAPHHWLIPRPPAPKPVAPKVAHSAPKPVARPAPAPVRSVNPPVPTTAEHPVIVEHPAPTPPPTPAVPSGYGCAVALDYLATHAAPGFIHECPGYAEGHQAMTCINVAGICPGEKVIAIADPCPAAYMNEASNSWVLERLRSGAIDPYGYCS